MRTLALDTGTFSADYASARAAFLMAADGRGKLETHPHSLTGPAGEALACDVLYQGPEDARAVLVTISATHGVEGFSGSAVQTHWLRDGNALPHGVAALHIHALNPWGFAWLRRVNEANVDLNRNFIDFSQPLPDNPGYNTLARHLLPVPGDESVAERALQAYRQQNGERAYEIAVSGGQYSDADGLFYGGVGMSWSRALVENVVGRYRLCQRQQVAVLDIHTGLGPYGYGELICDHPPGSPSAALVRAWYGPSVTEPALATSSSVPKHGLSDEGWRALLGDAVGFAALEFGTYPVDQLFRVIQWDHQLHRQAEIDWHAPETLRVKQAMRDHFNPNRQDWQEMVLFRARQVMLQALNALAGGLA